MYDTANIKQHMAVIDCDGRHVGTVDRVRGRRIHLMSEDAFEGARAHIDTDLVDRIENDRLVLRQGAQPEMSDVEVASASEYHHTADSPLAPARDNQPLFGTSGTGTGMGGSGAGEH